MEVDLFYGARHSRAPRSSNGCWTCRLRRKKCDENHPVCDACATLRISCFYGLDKPEWMDGGVRQEEMAKRLKREIKANAHWRGAERVAHVPNSHSSISEAFTAEQTLELGSSSRDLESPMCEILQATSNIHIDGTTRCIETSRIQPQSGTNCMLASKNVVQNATFEQSDPVLVTFHLEHLHPFLFPFYRPSLLQGGKAWLLELMLGSPVVRQAILCQSSYFFSLAQGVTDPHVIWETALMQTGSAFGVLRQALQVIQDSGVAHHLHGAVRIMTSIIQVQRFEIAISSFENCQAHLNAALALYEQLLDSSGDQTAGPNSKFNALMSGLGSLSRAPPTQSVPIPSAEQAAFLFSSALLIFDDIIASTLLQEQPRLYKYHCSLLKGIDGSDPSINLKAVVGCQNETLLQIGEIAVLDAWKQQRKRAGNLNVMELVHRATAIKQILETNLTQLENDPVYPMEKTSNLLDSLTADFAQQSASFVSQSSLATRVWTHAALIYLFVVVSGWQPASVEVRYHVGRVIELLALETSPPALLRNMVWPFCVAGCLAELAQEIHFRQMIEALQPPSIFGTIRTALDIMENVWSNRGSGNVANLDLATCFRSQGDLVLLV